MPHVNRRSLRGEFDTPKGLFKTLFSSGQMGTKSRALFQTLLMLF